MVQGRHTPVTEVDEGEKEARYNYLESYFSPLRGMPS
jgi:hypothetical protein